ncbi:MAG TPA: S8 family serine peptidase [Thermoanaerobaculia bacterium]|nr:S8 family serine peptidase [Thermoanaerobaculia bacterium]
MIHVPGRSALALTSLLLLPLLLGCAGLPEPATGRHASDSGEAPPETAQQVMVTYPSAPPSIWAQTTAELAQSYGMRVVVAWTMSSIGEHCVVFEVRRGRSARETVERLRSDPRINLAQTISTFETETGGDPYAHLQHGSQALHVEQAHRLATGRGVKVAVIDTGVDFDHPDLRGRIAGTADFVHRREGTFTTDVHGTAVAGLIGASANNDVGIVGVAPGAEIYALKACWPRTPESREAECNSYTLALAMDSAINLKVQIVNLSLAGPEDPLLGKLVGTALSHGIVVVAADGGAGHSFPASYKGVIGVLGSDDLKGELVKVSARTTSSVAAPAVDIISLAPRNTYDFFSGSSLAAAEVSGIAALLLEKNPKLTPAQVREVFRKTSHPIPPPPGLPDPPVAEADACAAVASLTGGDGCP